jgi:ubiquinone/menaquinone biosynthesis C-methylase UbiE
MTVRTALSGWLYDRGPGRYYQPAYGHIARAIGLESGSFLDVGCGPGWLSIRVAQACPEVEAFGIDLSPQMVARARAHRDSSSHTRFEQMDASQMSYPAGTFSAAAAVQSAHHWRDTPGILAEVHRVLRPGARFYIYEADRNQAEIPDGWVLRRGGWPPDRLVRLGWRRFGMDSEEWTVLCAQAEQSLFATAVDDRHGFYRRLVLTR